MIETEIVSTKQMIEEFRQEENPSKDVCAVILKVDHQKFNTATKSYDFKLFGKTMTEWVANSVYDAIIRYGNVNYNDDFLPSAKNLCEPNCKYTFVLFSDTPLFERKTYLQILEYFKAKKLSVLKLTRGYVFETEYLLRVENLLSPQTQYFDEEDFMICCDLKQMAMISEILKNRILNYFMKNGVIIKDPASTFIDADSQIEGNCTLYQNNQITGQSIIESGAVIGANCDIVNSVVCENSILNRCVVENSFVGKNCAIGYNCIIKNNAKIEDGVVVPPNVVIDGVVVKKEDVLKSFVTYK